MARSVLPGAPPGFPSVGGVADTGAAFAAMLATAMSPGAVHSGLLVPVAYLAAMGLLAIAARCLGTLLTS